MVRALMRSIFGRNAGASFCSISVQRTPRRPRSMASVKPVGPAPTMSTSRSMLSEYSLATPAHNRAWPFLLHYFFGPNARLPRHLILRCKKSEPRRLGHLLSRPRGGIGYDLVGG